MVREIDSEALHRRLTAAADLLLVDIRTPEEITAGIIPGSSHIPMHLIPLRLGELPRSRDLVLYCRSGARSYHACQFLQQQGYDRVTNLSGGIIDWVRHGFPLA